MPAAATLAPEASRGRAVCTVMTGSLLGIVLSRVARGFVAERRGWKTVHELAAASLVVFCLAAWGGLLPLPAASRMRCTHLMGSLARLWRQHAELRRAALAQGLVSTGFSAFLSSRVVTPHSLTTWAHPRCHRPQRHADHCTVWVHDRDRLDRNQERRTAK